ncbi:signal peptidase II [Psittacicella gerlachiana]|uniref:Lipoprotein signal peptidase n=1 Tax=Psittacicella gerlachiana TaxID=2028574 RepID=A0A3A1Y857_9GAMM|nr:signal peptidase II [Psittacicella gerlachiana]RIY33398.1 signal peptidase II [Psittacicella gerlachiana]
MKNKLIFYFLLILIILVGLDWYSKYYFDTNFNYGQSVSVIGETFLRWTLIYNYGFSFSIGSSYPELMRVLVGSFATLVGVVLTVFACSSVRSAQGLRDIIFSFAFVLIAAGALGNGIERLIYGRVIDFIHFTFAGKWSFAVFNVADIWINFGVYIIILTYIVDFFRNRKQVTK